MGPPQVKIVAESSLQSKDYDGVVLISSPAHITKGHHQIFGERLQAALKCDPGLKDELAVLPLPELPAGRLVHSPTGPILRGYDSVRVYKEAAAKGLKRALKAGIKSPLLVLNPPGSNDDEEFKEAELVTLLGVLEALYVPIQLRESDPSKANPISHLGVYTTNLDKTKQLVSLAENLESGRRVACDIGDADPERMAPPQVEQYIFDLFKGSSIKLNVVKDVQQLKKDFPLFEAVNRAASNVERHQGRIVFMEYAPSDQSKVEETLYLVGKGVTYDTGGIDLKISGAMIGMSRDKCGAAAVVGFMQVVNLMQPKNLRVVAGVSLVRNSIGSNGYVADELIRARSGAKVRIVNTDAEGRMAMADVLCKFKEDALKAINPHLFTVATLTGHACLSVGNGYSIVMDNAEARKSKFSTRILSAGEQIGDLFESSRIRPEDFQAHRGEMVGDDVKQSNSKPSSQTARGHQTPAAFLMLASGLDQYDLGSAHPLKYSHLDIAASAGSFPDPATGAPVLALAQNYLINN